MKENELLKQEVSDLRTNLEINKQLLRGLENSTTVSDYGQQPVDISNACLG
jgi:hypothetical protein